MHRNVHEAITRLLFNDCNPADDDGSATTEWVLMLIVTIGVATAVGAIVAPLITGAAESIDLGVTP